MKKYPAFDIRGLILILCIYLLIHFLGNYIILKKNYIFYFLIIHNIKKSGTKFYFLSFNQSFTKLMMTFSLAFTCPLIVA